VWHEPMIHTLNSTAPELYMKWRLCRDKFCAGGDIFWCCCRNISQPPPAAARPATAPATSAPYRLGLLFDLNDACLEVEIRR